MQPAEGKGARQREERLTARVTTASTASTYGILDNTIRREKGGRQENLQDKSVPRGKLRTDLGSQKIRDVRMGHHTASMDGISSICSRIILRSDLFSVQ